MFRERIKIYIGMEIKTKNGYKDDGLEQFLNQEYVCIYSLKSYPDHFLLYLRTYLVRL